jgi:DNA-binding MarR family transcriptional regulator
MESKQNRALKEFDSLYKMIDDVYHEIALSMHLTDSAFLILYCLLELGDGCSQKDICKLYSISKQTVNSSVKSLEDKGVLIRKAGVGRDIHLFFTEFGREFSEKHIGPVFDMENATFESMEPSECEHIFSYEKICSDFKEKYETICLRGKGFLVYHEDSIIRSFHLQTSDPFCISIDHYDDLYFDVQYY